MSVFDDSMFNTDYNPDDPVTLFTGYTSPPITPVYPSSFSAPPPAPAPLPAPASQPPVLSIARPTLAEKVPKKSLLEAARERSVPIVEPARRVPTRTEARADPIPPPALEPLVPAAAAMEVDEPECRIERTVSDPPEEIQVEPPVPTVSKPSAVVSEPPASTVSEPPASPSVPEPPKSKRARTAETSSRAAKSVRKTVSDGEESQKSADSIEFWGLSLLSVRERTIYWLTNMAQSEIPDEFKRLKKHVAELRCEVAMLNIDYPAPSKTELNALIAELHAEEKAEQKREAERVKQRMLERAANQLIAWQKKPDGPLDLADPILSAIRTYSYKTIVYMIGNVPADWFAIDPKLKIKTTQMQADLVNQFVLVYQSCRA